MDEAKVRAMLTMAGFTVEKLWKLPNGYYGEMEPLSQDAIQRDKPGHVGFMRTGDDCPTEGVVINWMEDYRHRHKYPWWLIKTEFGLIMIGWRKRVINIDWSDTPGRPSGNTLTADDTTKDTTVIHAWSELKAIEYLTALKAFLHSQALAHSADIA
jgi:hypothetical protein